MKLSKSSLLLTAAVLIAACSTNREAKLDLQAVDDHESGQQVTLFSENIEFFVEFPQLMTGQHTDFTVHLTRLDNYKTVSEGTVSVILQNKDGKITGTSTQPLREGIYEVGLSPQQAGKTEVRFSLEGEGFSESVSVKDIDVYTSHDEMQEAEEHSGGEISFTKENAWNSDFMVSLIEPVPFADVINAGGEILAIPAEKYHIHALSSGIVSFNKKNLVAGARVAAGEQLVSLKGEGLADGNISVAFAEAGSRFYRSKSDYERKRVLLAENAVSEKEFIQSHSDYLIDSIHYHNLENSFGDGGLQIVAPIEGYIHELAVSQGEFVSVGQLIATISSDKRLLLRADVPQQYFGQIRDIISTHFRTSYSPDVLDIESMEGKLLAIGSSVAENNHFLPVYFEARNKGNLLEGAFAEFYLKTHTVENAIVVPKTAVTEEQGRYFVYVQASGESYLKREIFIADSDGMKYRVEKGLSTGERVVSRGSMLLKTASISTALPSSHEH